MNEVRFDEPEMEIIPLLCQGDGISVDVGGCGGAYARVMAEYSQHVEVFEPNPHLAGKISIPQNATWHSIALSSSNGVSTLRMPLRSEGQPIYGLGTLEDSNQFGGAFAQTAQGPVETRSLDSFELQNVLFMKIDVEGHEIEVLKGAKDTLVRCSPALLVEIEERHKPGTIQAVVSFLESLEYTSWYLHGHQLFPYREFRLQEHQNRANLDELGIYKTGTYINNFIFLQHSHQEPFRHSAEFSLEQH